MTRPLRKETHEVEGAASDQTRQRGRGGDGGIQLAHDKETVGTQTRTDQAGQWAQAGGPQGQNIQKIGLIHFPERHNMPQPGRENADYQGSYEHAKQIVIVHAIAPAHARCDLNGQPNGQQGGQGAGGQCHGTELERRVHEVR